ncbi:hypothetical protein MNBD_NITROSPIRAE01-1309 [hydrothermal vent metagenome]|uniref:Cytochrome c domain-containing protein n=1 Tax=hydrothermal vent metagenome TaxID=652676 RepID=A0A3B1CI84_9ZZZZ
MNVSNSDQSVPIWKLVLVFIAVIALTVLVFKGPPTSKEKKGAIPIEEKVAPDLDLLFSAETLVSEGEFVIFGRHQPVMETSPSGKFDRMPIGKGKCAHCHIFVKGQRQDIGPNLIGLEQRSHTRLQEARYQMFSEKYQNMPEAVSGLKATATTGGEYILESIYCPSCYVVAGFGLPESNDLVSKMPVMNHMPYQLSDYEIIAIVSYLQAKTSSGGLSKVTAVEDWQNYFKKELPLPEDSPKVFASSVGLAITEELSASVEEVIKKNGCSVCHKIPGIEIAQTGLIGPILAMKSTAPRRLASKEYQEAVLEGRAKAITNREYVKESILNPSAFIPPGFRGGDGMPSDYSQKMTLGDLDKLLHFLLTIDETMINKEDRSSPVGLSELTR